MSMWEKLKDDFQKSVTSVSEKTAELVKEGTEKATSSITYTTKVAQLNVEKLKTEKAIAKEFTELGGVYYDHHSKKTLSDFKTAAKDNFARLLEMHNKLQDIDRQRTELDKEHGETVDKASVKELTSGLEEHGGTIRQAEIKSGAPVLGKKIKEIVLPKEALIGTILRGDRVVIPDGGTEFQQGDRVTLLGKVEDVEKAIVSLTGE